MLFFILLITHINYTHKSDQVEFSLVRPQVLPDPALLQTQTRARHARMGSRVLKLTETLVSSLHWRAPTNAATPVSALMGETEY